jgi:hypothetical protein
MNIKENSSRQGKLNNLIKTKGIVLASKVVGSIENLARILELDLTDNDVQEKLIKNFINFGNFLNVEVSFLAIRTSKTGNKIIDVHYINDDNSPFYREVINNIVNQMNNFFPFKVDSTGVPVFYSRGLTAFIDATPINTEEDDDELIQESIRRILKEENFIPLVIRRRLSSDEIEEAFDYALERMGRSMNNQNSVIYKEKKHTTLGLFAKFVIDEMVTYLEQDYFNDDNRIYFSDDDYYYDKIRKPLLRHYGKRIKERYNKEMGRN